MNPTALSLLQSPKTGKKLQLIPSVDGQSDHLVNQATSESYPIRDDIPDFINKDAVNGSNGKYQRLYNSLAPWYDFSVKLYALFRTGGDRARVMEYLQELEVKPGDRVLETSIGTGRNMMYLPQDISRYGIDISENMLRQCQKKGRSQDWDLNLFLCPAETLCF
jgi:uncharacterized protein YbaR (Trm112 family)